MSRRAKTRFDKDESLNPLVEKLAQLEHEQWMYYSKDVARRVRNAGSLIDLQDATLKKWQKNWKPYSTLSEAEKAKDRIWAYKVMKLIKENEDLVHALLTKMT